MDLNSDRATVLLQDIDANEWVLRQNDRFSFQWK